MHGLMYSERQLGKLQSCQSRKISTPEMRKDSVHFVRPLPKGIAIDVARLGYAMHLVQNCMLELLL